MYIREAHAIDSRSPMFQGPLVEDPITSKERHEVAAQCVTALELKMIPAVVDAIDDAANQAYGGWPDRLYLIGRDGKVAYAGGRGPFGFKPDELAAAITTELERKPKREKGN